MKITTTEKAAVDASYVRVAFDTKKGPLLIEKDGSTTLVIHRESKESADKRKFRTLVRTIIRCARTFKIEKLAFDVTTLLTKDTLTVYTREQALRTFAENALIAQYEFTRYKTGKTKEAYASDIILFSAARADAHALEAGVTVGTYVNRVRDMANTPGGDMTPQVLARDAQNLAKGTSVKVTVLGEKEIAKEKMGAILGVSKGSSEKPRFIIMEYWGAGKRKSSKARGKRSDGAIDQHNPIVLIGKGITFDTGGLNLKPSDSVLDMHLDMSGGAAVIGAIVCAAELKLKKNIIALIPAAENMVSGESYRPGDVLTTMSGKTVEVLNTDAEGRLVLADALTYAERYNPKVVIDVATLTGAALAALGQHASAIMTPHLALQEALMRFGEESGDYVWPLPLWSEYKQHTKGTFADLANIPSSGARYGGSINGGTFLSHFAEKYTWAHIDMAPRMTAAAGDQLSKGATGEPMRLLITLVEQY